MGMGDRASDPNAGREDAPSEEWAELLRAVLNAKNAHGTDSEIAARARKYFETAPHLLDAPNPDGWTLAYACVWRNRPRTLLCLLDLGASPLPLSNNTERNAAQTAHAEGRRLCRKILRMSRDDVAKWARSAELPPNDEHDLPEDKPKKGPKRPSKRSQEMTRMLCSADMLDKQIAKVFMKHDTENDGEISTVELSACFREVRKGRRARDRAEGARRAARFRPRPRIVANDRRPLLPPPPPLRRSASSSRRRR